MCDPKERKTLISRYTECTKFLGRVCEVVSAREEALDKLMTFYDGAQELKDMLERLENDLKTAVITSDQLTSWQQEAQDLQSKMKDCSRNGSGLDQVLQQAQITALDNIDSKQRTTVRGYLNRLEAKCDRVLSEIANKQEKYDEVDDLWRNFLDRKERLIKSVDDIEEKASTNIEMGTVTQDELQELIKQNDKLKDELDAKQYESNGLRSKGKQLMEADPSQSQLISEHLQLVDMSWEDAEQAITETDEQLTKLLNLLKDYEFVKERNVKTLKNAESIAESAEAPRHFNMEEVKRHMAKLESLKDELDERQSTMDDMAKKGKLFAAYVKKVLVCDTGYIDQELEDIVDRYLDVQDKVEETLENLQGQLGLWKELAGADEEMEDWMNTSINDLNASISSLDDSAALKDKLAAVHEEIDKHKSHYETLQDKVTEMHKFRRRTSVGEMDELTQVNENMKNKLEKALAVYKQAQLKLDDFTSQHTMLSNYVAELNEWLKLKEKILKNLMKDKNTEELNKAREIHTEISGQQDNVESAKEHLNSLCRKYQNAELNTVQEKVGQLTSTYDEVFKLSLKVIELLESSLEEELNTAVKSFYSWYRAAKEVLSACADTSADIPVLEERLQKLQSYSAKTEEGQSKLNTAVEAGEHYIENINRNTETIEEQITNMKEDWHKFLGQLEEEKTNLEYSLSGLRSLEENRKDLATWLKEVEKRLREEEDVDAGLEDKTARLEKLETINKDLSSKSQQVETLLQQAYELVEGDSSQNTGARKAHQLISYYHGICKKAKEHLRECEQIVNDQRQYEESLLSAQEWIQFANTKLDSCVETSVYANGKEELEESLNTVQDLLLKKQEGEVKLNVALGKGERAMEKSTHAGKDQIKTDINQLKNDHDDFIEKLSECKTRLDQKLVDWSQYAQAKDELVTWLKENEVVLSGSLAPAVDLKDKEAQLEKYKLLLQDIESHKESVDVLHNKAMELNQDEDFKEKLSQYDHVLSLAQERTEHLESCVKTHEGYYEAVQDFCSWINSAKEELNRWSDTAGDKETVQKKLTKVLALKASRTHGRQKLDTATEIGDHVIANTAEEGRGVIRTELASLKEEWRSWDRGMTETEIALQTRLSQLSEYEKSFGIERSALQDALSEFQSKLEKVQAKMPQEGTEEITKSANAFKTKKLCQSVLQELDELQESVDALKARLNGLCRSYQSPEIDQLSKQVTTSLQQYDNTKLKLVKTRTQCEKNLLEAFQTSVRDFESWLKAKKELIQYHGDVSGNKDAAKNKLQHIQGLLSSAEEGKTKLNSLISLGDELPDILGPESSENVRHQTKHCKEAWRNFLAIIQEKEQSLQSYVEQLTDFDSSVAELTKWLNDAEERFQAETGLRATIGLKKSQFNSLQAIAEDTTEPNYKFERLKRKAHKLGSSPELSKLNQLTSQYHNISKQVQDALKRSEQNLLEHQAYQTAFTEAQEWINDFSHRLETYSNMTGDKEMLEQRLHKLETILGGKQEGEVKINITRGHSEKILPTTAPRGQPTIKSQVNELVQSWEENVAKAEEIRNQLRKCIGLWEKYEEAVKYAHTWLQNTDVSVKAEKIAHGGQGLSPEALFSDLEKCRLLYRDIKNKSGMIDNIQQCANKIANITGDVSGTRVDLAEIREHYQELLNAAQGLLNEAETEAESAKSYHQALHIFTDWFSGKSMELFKLSDTSCGKEMLQENIKALEKLQEEIPEGEEKLKQAISAGKRSSPDKSIKLQLQTLRDEWNDYRTKLEQALVNAQTLIQETAKYEKICKEFLDWISAMEQCPDAEIQLTSSLSENRDLVDRYKSYSNEISANQSKLDKLNKAAQQLVDACGSTDGNISMQVTQMTSRYQTLIIRTKDKLRKFQDTIQLQTEFDSEADEFDKWLQTTDERFAMYTLPENIDADNAQMCSDKLDELLSEFESHKVALSLISDKSSKLTQLLDQAHTEGIRGQTAAQHEDFQELYTRIQAERRNLHRTLHYYEDYQDSMSNFKTWMTDMQHKVNAKPEIIYELFEKKAQLARFSNYHEEILKNNETLQTVILKARRLPDNIRESREVEHLNEEYHRLAQQSQQRINELKARVKVHQDYFEGMQSAEKWLLSKSSQIMAASSQDFPSELDVSQQSAEKFESQLQEFQGTLEEINNFRTEVQSLSSMSKRLLNEYDDKPLPLEGQVRSQLDKLQTTYATVHAAALQLVDRLKSIVHKQQDFNVKLQQIRSWLSEKQAAVKISMTYKPASLQEAQHAVKELAFIAVELEEKLEFVQENLETHPAEMDPVNQQLESFQLDLDEKMQNANDIATEWLAVTEAQNEFKEWLLEAETSLDRLGDAPSEIISEAAVKHLGNCRSILEDIDSKKILLNQLKEKYDSLLGPDAAVDPDFQDVQSQWEHLRSIASNLCAAQEKNLSATEDFSTYFAAVETVVENFKSDVEALIRNTTDDTDKKLAKAKEIVQEMGKLRGMLDNLSDKMQSLTPRMSVHDADSVEDKYRNLNQKWIDCEQKAQSRLQMLQNIVSEMTEYRNQLADISAWLSDIKQKIIEPVPMTLSVDELNAARQNHNLLCKELAHKKEEFNQLTSCHQTLPLNLSSQERELLQHEVEDLQRYFKEIQKSANDKTNDLNHAIGRRKDLWATAQQAIAWLDHLKESLESHQHPPLHPDAVAKLIQDHRVLHREIIRHKKTVDDVTATGLQIVYEGKPEGVSVKGKLSGLEDKYAEVDNLWTQKMEELQYLLADRELFHADVDRALRWLKEADIVTFPEVNLAAPLTDLETQVGKYHQITSESATYQDLVHKIQDKAEQIRPKLSDVDQEILDEKIKMIEDQFNLVCAAAVDKDEHLEEMMSSRRDYTNELEHFEEYLATGQTMLQELDALPTGHTSARARDLLAKAKETQEILAEKKPSLDSIEKMRDSLKNSGQPWQPEGLLKATAIYHRLMQQSTQRIERFSDMSSNRENFERRTEQLSAELKEYERTLAVGSASRAEHKLSECQKTAADLTSSQIELRSISGLAEQLCADMDQQDKSIIREKVDKLRRLLHALQAEIGEKQRELEKRLISRKDFQGDLEQGLVWLEEMQAAIECDKPLKLDTQSVQEEMKKLQLIQEEVQSRLRMLISLGQLEIDKYQEEGEEPPASVNRKLDQLYHLKEALTSAILAKQIRLEDAYASRQKYSACLSKVQSQLGSASAELQLLSGDNSPRQARSLLKEHQAADVIHQYQALFTTEDEVLHNIEELNLVAKDLEQSPALSNTARRALAESVGNAKERAGNLLDRAHEIRDNLQTTAVNWEGFDGELEKVQAKIQKAELKLNSIDCTMPGSVFEARCNVENFQPALSDVSLLDHEVQALHKVSESLSSDSFAGRMSVNRSITAVKARIERLQTRSKEIERLLNKHLRDWETYHQHTSDAKSVLDRIESRMPVKQIEKCTAFDLSTQKSLLASLNKDLSSTSRRLSTVHDASQNISRNLDSPESRDVDREVRDVETKLQSLAEEASNKLSGVKKEMDSREALQTELHDLLQWINDSKYSADRSVDLTPAPSHVQDKIDALKQLKDQLASKKEYFTKMSETQQKKYLDKFSILPAEISTTMAKIKVAFTELEEEIENKEKELDAAKSIREEYQQELLEISTLLSNAELKLTEDIKDYSTAEKEHKALKAEIDKCHIRLVSLDAMAVEIAEQTTYESSRISINAAISAVNEQYARVQELAHARARKFSNAADYLTEVEETHSFLRKWRSKAENILAGPLTMRDLQDAKTQLRENKALRNELKQLRKEIDRMRDRIPDVGAAVDIESMEEESFESLSTGYGTGTIPSSSFFSKKIDQMGSECMDLEKKIKEREDVLSESISTAFDMEQDTKAIRDGVANLRDRYPAQDQNAPVQEQLASRKRMLGQLEKWKRKLDAVRTDHPFASTPDPSPRRDSSEVPVPKLALDQLHETPAIKLAEDTERVIDDLELSLTSDIHALESLLRESEPYEEEIARLTDLLSDARHRLNNLPLSGSGSPRSKKAELDEYKKLLKEVEKYEKDLKELKEKKRKLMEGRSQPSYDEPDSKLIAPVSRSLLPVSETVDPTSIERQHTDPDSELYSMLFDTLGSSVSQPTSASPVRSQKDGSRLSKFLSREMRSPGDLSSPSTPSEISSASTSSLLEADILSPSLNPDKSKLEEEIPGMPLPIDASSPYMVDAAKYRRMGERMSIDDDDRDELGEKVKELLSSFREQDNVRSDIQEITMKLNECQERLDAPEMQMSLQEQFDQNQALLDEINLLQSKLESVERWTSSLAHDYGGKETLNATVSVLYDRWDTMRMQATSKQNVIEIKMLEEEQYCRMVEAYKAELEQVTEWMEDAKKIQQRMTSESASQHPPTIGSLTDDLSALQKHIKDCESTVADVERKLRLISELTGESLPEPSALRPVPPLSSRSHQSSVYSIVVSPPSPSSSSTSSSDKTLSLSRGDKEGAELLEQLDSVKDGLEDLQKSAVDKGKQYQDELEAKQDEAIAQYQTEVSKMQDWLSEVKSSESEQTLDKDYKKFQSDLQQHQTLLEEVVKLGRTMAAQRLSPLRQSTDSKTPVERKKSWDKMVKELQDKNLATEELFLNLPKTSTPVKKSTLGSDSPPGGRATVEDIKQRLQDLQDCWNEMKEQSLDSQEALERLQQQTQNALEAVSEWMDDVESHLSRRGSLEAERKLQNILKSEMGSIQSQMGKLRNVNDNMSSAMAEPDFAESLKSALQSLSERLSALEREAKERELALAEKDMDQKEFQADLAFTSNEISDLLDEVQSFSIGEFGELPELDERMKEMKESASECEEKLKALERKAEKLEFKSWGPADTEMHQVSKTFEKLKNDLSEKSKTLDGVNQEEVQFAQMLLDYSDALNTGQEKLEMSRIAIKDLNELKSYVEKFKEYFDGLQKQRSMCVELASKLSSIVLKLHELTFTELKAKHSTLENRAVSKEQQLGKVAKDWKRVSSMLQQHQSTVTELECKFLAIEPNEESIPKLKEDVECLRNIQKKMAGLETEIHQAVDEADNIFLIIKCDDLKSNINEASERLLLLGSKVDQELERLTAILEMLPKSNTISTNINAWLTENSDKPAKIVQDIEASDLSETAAKTKAKEFQKIVQEFQKIKMSENELRKLVEKLHQLKRNNLNKMKDRMTDIENETAKMEKSLPELSERLHKAQVNLLPVQQAISQMVSWVEQTNASLDVMKRDSYETTGSQAVQDHLASYKAYHMEIRVKQVTIDFINKSSASADPFSPRQSEVEFADKLGHMNMEWEILKARVDNCISQLEPELVKWTEHEKAINKIQHWIDDHLETCQQNSEPGNKSQIQRALLKLQGLEPKLKKKYSEIRRLEKDYKDLVATKNNKFRAESPEPGVGSSNLARLNQTWVILEHHLNQQKRNLKKAMEVWERFNSVENVTTKQLDSIEHSLLQCSKAHASMEAVAAQLSKLEELQHELRRHSLQQQLFQVESSSLIAICDVITADDVRGKINSLDARWNELSASVDELFSKYKKSLEVWSEYENQYQQAENKLYTVKSQSDSIMTSQTMLEDPQQCEMKAQELLHSCSELETSIAELSTFGDEIGQLMTSSSAVHINGQNTRIEQALTDTNHHLQNTIHHLKNEKSKIMDFKEKYGFLETWLNEAESAVEQNDTSIDEKVIQSRMEELKIQLQAFKTYSTLLDELNSLGYQLPLQDVHVTKLQHLNARWNEISKKTAEMFQHLQSLHLRHLNFTEKCESWMLFIAQMESSLTNDVASTYEGLLEQSRTLELFTIEMMGRQLILQAIISDGEKLLENGSDEERSEFKTKLDELSSQWQMVMKRMQQRKFTIDEGIKLWVSYNQQKHRFVSWMESAKKQIRELDCEKRIHQTVHGMKSDLEKLNALEKSASLNEVQCSSTLEAGKDVVPITHDFSTTDLKKELSSLHNDWLAINKTIQQKKRDLQSLLCRWNDCEHKITEMLGWLRDTKKVLAQSDSVDHDEIHSAMIKCRDREIMFDMTGDKLRALEVSVEELCSDISRADIALLRQRAVLVRNQWEELREQTQQRKSLIEARLGEWDDFDEKYRELCEWLNDMEEKISQNPELPIEDLMEKLEKQYQNEMFGAEDRKAELQSLGEKLIGGHRGHRSQEVEYKLNKLVDRWKNLEKMNKTRSKKLKETLQAVAQLEKSMEDLRTWLKDVEDGLTDPVVYRDSNDREIVERLTQQQALQRDIEKHSSGVASVLNLCEVLLHDGDACSNESEKDSIEQATNSLDRRWRNICSLSMERKLKIEETQRLWKKFFEDYSRFGDWLKSAERVVSRPNTFMISYQVAREELKRFESFQRQVHESLTQLELINKQYRRLARENRTDASNKLKHMIHDGNSRWDAISHRVASILRRLKYAIQRREGFETKRESLLVWLTETDLRLTNVEHFMQSENYDKLKEVKNFQATIEEHIPRIIELDARGLFLIEKSEESDCVVVEEELSELHRYCREVIARLDRYHKRLLRIMNEPPPLDSSLFEDTELAQMSWWENYISGTSSSRNSSPSLQSPDHDRFLATPRSQGSDRRSATSHSGRATPESLEWDLYDISQSELETKDAGALTDDGSIPEISPFETASDDIPLLHVSRDSTGTRQSNISRRSHDVSVSHEPADLSPAKKLRTSQDEMTQQFMNDLIATLAWLDATTKVTNQEMKKSESKFDKTISDLDQQSIELKSLQASIEQRKAIVLSINLVSSSYSGNSDVTIKLSSMNNHWESLQQKSMDWNKSLQESLSNSQEFQSALTELSAWVGLQNHHRDDMNKIQQKENADSSPTSRMHRLRKDHKVLDQIRIDTLEAISKVTSMQDICIRLTTPGDKNHPVGGTRALSEKVRSTNGRLKALLDAVRSDLRDIEHKIKATRRRVREERSSESDSEISTDGALRSSTPIRLRMLQRKVEASELHSSGKNPIEDQEMATTQPTDTPTKGLYDVTQESCSSIDDVTHKSLHARSKLRNQGQLGTKTVIGKAVAMKQTTVAAERRGITVAMSAKRTKTGRMVTTVIPSENTKKAGLCCRVCFAAFPFYLLMLLLFLLPWFLQATSDDGFACLRQNNYAFSFTPMLTYTNGPPPV
ncbi:nesprin-1-like isoform X1 [Styela clava]